MITKGGRVVHRGRMCGNFGDRQMDAHTTKALSDYYTSPTPAKRSRHHGKHSPRRINWLVWLDPALNMKGAGLA